MSGAVFLSYASADIEAARRLCEALRAAGIEVWFDQSELHGGDAWDTKIRRQIKDCTLFLPVISANTQARREGYFRLEWKLADDRTHLMARGTPFLVPVCVDGTKDSEALAPDSFFQAQWIRLTPAGEQGTGSREQGAGIREQELQALARRVRQLLAASETVAGGDLTPGIKLRGVGAPLPQAIRSGRRKPTTTFAGVVIIALLAAGAWFWFSQSTNSQLPSSGAASAAPVAEKSIAVLPFENLSTDPENAFFTDGMHDEVITALGKVQSLRVIGRTSVLAYADPKARQLPAIARALNVTSILEGTVRRDGRRVKINVQLVDPATSRQIWGDSYERDLTDAFAIQGAIATEVAGKLEAKLTPEAKALLARKPTDNVQALENYLKGRLAKATLSSTAPLAEWEGAVRFFEEAVRADPKFLQAFATVAVIHCQMYNYTRIDPNARRAGMAQAALAAAIAIDPQAPETRFAEGAVAMYVERDFPKASRLLEPLLDRLPGDDYVVSTVGLAQRAVGRHPEGAATLTRALTLNPQDLNTYANLTTSLMMLRRFDTAVALPVPTQSFSARATETYRRNQDVSRFEQTGDRNALLEARRASPRQGRDPTGLLAEYEVEFWAGNWSAARTILADGRLAPDLVIEGLNPNSLECVALHRALMSWLAGDREAARREAQQANAIIGSRAWPERQQTYADAAVLLGTALTRDHEATGQRANALRQKTARASDFDRPQLVADIGRAWSLLGEKDEALAVLRELLTGPGAITVTPRAVRLDPCWSQLASDPRFDQIIGAARRL